MRSGVAFRPVEIPSIYSLAEFIVKIDQLEVAALAVKLEGFQTFCIASSTICPALHDGVHGKFAST